MYLATSGRVTVLIKNAEESWIGKNSARAAFPSGCLSAQTKRWAEGIRVQAPPKVNSQLLSGKMGLGPGNSSIWGKGSRTPHWEPAGPLSFLSLARRPLTILLGKA